MRLNLWQHSRQLVYDAAGIAVAIVMIFPIYWMVATAFKPGQDILRLEPKWFPNPITLQNFQDAIQRPYFLDDVKNSLIVVSVTMDTVAQIQSHLIAQQYEGLIKKSKLRGMRGR